MGIQQRVPGPGAGGTVWVSPARDLAHIFPQMVRNAIQLTERDIETSDESEETKAEQMACLGEYARALARFIKIAADPDADVTMEQAFKDAGLHRAPDALHRHFGKWLSRVVLCAYFPFIREALHPGERPVGFKELDTYIDNALPAQPRGKDEA